MTPNQDALIAELKPCPFCGSEAVVHSQDSGKCACDNRNCEIYLIFFNISAWNTRAQSASPEPSGDVVRLMKTVRGIIEDEKCGMNAIGEAAYRLGKLSDDIDIALAAMDTARGEKP